MDQAQFLRECGKSYPEAMAALAHFRELVQQECKTIVARRIEEFCRTLSVSRRDLRILAYAEPDLPVAVLPDNLYLGCQAKRSENLYLTFYLYWDLKPEEDSASVGVGISIWIADAKKRRDLAAELMRHGDDAAFRDDDFVVEGHEFWTGMREAEIPQLGDKLDALCGYTIKFLSSLWGIEKYFRTQ